MRFITYTNIDITPHFIHETMKTIHEKKTAINYFFIIDNVFG